MEIVAVSDFDGGGDTYSIWGNATSSVGDFCCFVDDASLEIDRVELFGTDEGTNGDDIRLPSGKRMEKEAEVHGLMGPDDIDGSDWSGGVGTEDTILGGSGGDTIDCNAGEDYVEGGPDADIIHGNDGDDNLLGELGADDIWGDDGYDTIFGGDAIDELNGGDGNDLIHGDNGADIINGNGGRDDLYGDDGADLVCSGLGAQDSLYGGTISSAADGDVDTLYVDESATNPNGEAAEGIDLCGDYPTHATWTTGSCTDNVSATPSDCDP
jgi:Ca2+-binding RTX toxin-like protein